MACEVFIDPGESLHVLSGWSELDPNTVYLLPVKAVKLYPGRHILNPAGQPDRSANVRIRLMAEGERDSHRSARETR